MRVRLEPMFDMSAVAREMEQAVSDAALEKLVQVGDRAIELVRVKIKNQGGYDNHTGNLRSSTGYIIHKDGKVVYENFKESPEGTDKKTGLEEGQKLAFGEHRSSQGWGILLVSGMEYASWVENKGYDVLTGARIGFANTLQQAFNEIGGIG